ncbi:hypothetical protein IKK_02774 [Bacillus mycoides]|nr:hypothetical protein IKK_02774 [Bacillus mycoides]
MNIKWNSENIIFETLREAEVWTDSIGMKYMDVFMMVM